LKTNVLLPSERSFGLIFSLVFLLLGCYSFYEGKIFNLYYLAVSFIFLLFGIFLPILLRPFNLIWFYFGMGVSKITNPLILGLFFYVVFTLMRFLLWLFGVKTLDLKINKKLNSYWVIRPAEEKDVNSFKNQF
jgi:hypothetical protein